MVALYQPLLLSLSPISHHHAWRCFFFWHQDHTESFFSLARTLLLILPGPDAAEAHVGTGRHSAVGTQNIYSKEKAFPLMLSQRGEAKRPSGINRSCSLACFSCLIGLRTSELPPSPSPLCCTTSQKETLAPNSPSYIAFCCMAKHSFFFETFSCNVNLSRLRNQQNVGGSKIVIVERVRFSTFVLEPCLTDSAVVPSCCLARCPAIFSPLPPSKTSRTQQRS